MSGELPTHTYMPYSDREKHRAWERDYLKRKRKEQPEYYLLKGAKMRAKKLNLDFNLTLDDIVIPEFCPYLGIPLIVNVGTRRRTPGSPSLDRLDNSKGYIKGNVIVCSWRANFLKSDATIQELTQLQQSWLQLLSPKPEEKTSGMDI